MVTRTGSCPLCFSKLRSIAEVNDDTIPVATASIETDDKFVNLYLANAEKAGKDPRDSIKESIRSVCTSTLIMMTGIAVIFYRANFGSGSNSGSATTPISYWPLIYFCVLGAGLVLYYQRKGLGKALILAVYVAMIGNAVRAERFSWFLVCLVFFAVHVLFVPLSLFNKVEKHLAESEDTEAECSGPPPLP
jgi:hypothetical protein